MTRENRNAWLMCSVGVIVLITSLLGLWASHTQYQEAKATLDSILANAPGPVPPIPSEADIIAHGTGSEPYDITVPRGDLSRNRTIILPDTSSEIMTKDSLERDLKLRIVCKEEKTTGKQVNPSSTTAWIPCSRIDQLWMDGQKVWERPKK
jgi:hypothetical protein